MPVARRPDVPLLWFLAAAALAAAAAPLAQEPRNAVAASLFIVGVAAFVWRPFALLLLVVVAAYKDSPLVLLVTVAAGSAVLLAQGRSAPGWAVRGPFLALVLFAVWRLPLDPSFDEDITRFHVPGLGWEYLDRISEELIAWIRVAFVLVMFSLAAWQIRSVTRLRQLAVALMVGAVPAVFVGLKELAAGQYVQRDGLDVINGPFPFPNYFSFYLLEVILLGLVLLFETRSARWRLALAVLLAGASVCMLFTYTRSAWTALVVGFLVVALLRDRRLLLVGAAAAALTVFAFPESADRVEDRFSNLNPPAGVETNSWTWRRGQWSQMVDYGYDKPWTGQGFGTYQQLTVREFGTRGQEFNTVSTTNDGRTVARGFTAHNDFVRMFVELGVPGLLLWVATLIGLLATAIRARRIPGVAPYAAATTGILVAAYTMSATDNLMSYTAALLVPVVLVGGIAGAAARARRAEAPAQPS